MNEEWIPKSERLPTEADADNSHCVLVWHLYDGCMITGWHQVEQNRFITHWQKCPDEPAGAHHLRLEFEREVYERYGYIVQ